MAEEQNANIANDVEMVETENKPETPFQPVSQLSINATISAPADSTSVDTSKETQSNEASISCDATDTVNSSSNESALNIINETGNIKQPLAEEEKEEEGVKPKKFKEDHSQTFEDAIVVYMGYTNSSQVTHSEQNDDVSSTVSADDKHTASTVAQFTTPTAIQTDVSTVAPPSAPTASPPSTPTAAPLSAPTASPPSAPAAATPSATPSTTPSAPLSAPTEAPTEAPTVATTSTLTTSPTAVPTATSTAASTTASTAAPTVTPTVVPTTVLAAAPTAAPTSEPLPTAKLLYMEVHPKYRKFKAGLIEPKASKTSSTANVSVVNVSAANVSTAIVSAAAVPAVNVSAANVSTAIVSAAAVPAVNVSVASVSVVNDSATNVSAAEVEMSLPGFTYGPVPAIKNCYQMFLDIRKQVNMRRKSLFPVQPKPPSGFKDYLMNRRTYVLAGNEKDGSVSKDRPIPANLHEQQKKLFVEQEQERQKLYVQHIVEKEKLVLCIEQEILRVHGRAARELANQRLPFSACTILKDDEVYNVIVPDEEIEKDMTAKSCYSDRLFLSWLQNVDDKWEKIIESLILRQQNEAESLHAVQKMDWECKLKELKLCALGAKPNINVEHVPMIPVNENFNLLPA